jgi:hypothetical protein
MTEPHDRRGPAVIAVRSTGVSDGIALDFVGPFPTVWQAAEWWAETFEGQLGMCATIILLKDPGSESEADGAARSTEGAGGQ